MLDVIEKLLILRDRDKVILQVEAELRGLATERTATQARTADAEVGLAEGKDKANHIESDRKQLENDAALQQQAKEKYLGQQMQTKDNIEYQAFGRQIKTCENKISEIEDQELELMMGADTQAEVRSGEGKGGGSPARAGRCASLWAVWWKEGAVAAVRRAWHRASWAAAMGTLLGTRRSRGWRMGGAAAGETGARIGGARAAGSGVAKPPSQPSVGAGRGGALEGTELWPLRAVHISAGGGGELYIAMPAGRTA